MSSEFSKDELVAPPWLDQGYFERVLQSFENDTSITVQKFVITPGTKVGEHFASVIYRVDVIYASEKYKSDNKNIKVILKTYPSEDKGAKAEFLKDSPAFRNEVQMYTKVIPKMERILEGIGENTKFAPKLIYQNLKMEPLPVIVFEDVSPLGFVTFEASGVEELDRVNVIVKKLAKFHACSMFLQDAGDHLDDFNQHYFKDELEKPDSAALQTFRLGFNILVAEMKNWGRDFQLLAGKLEGKVDEVFKHSLKVYKRDAKYKVLCHGIHGKNLLYKNDCSKDEDLLMINYQFPFWTSPAYDLYYIFTLVAHSDLVEIHRNNFILTYYLEFNLTLHRLGYRRKPPTLLDLHTEIINCAAVELFQLTTYVHPRYIDYATIEPEVWSDVEAMTKIAVTAYQNPAYRDFMQKNLERHLCMGTLDF